MIRVLIQDGKDYTFDVEFDNEDQVREFLGMISLMMRREGLRSIIEDVANRLKEMKERRTK